MKTRFFKPALLVIFLSVPRILPAHPWPYPALEVDPRIELAVLIQILALGPESPDISKSELPYAQEALARFKAHAGHSAVRMYKRMAQSGLRPLDLWLMILDSTHGFPNIRLRRPPEDFFQRKILDTSFKEFIESMADFAKKYQFKGFFEEQKPYIGRCLAQALKDLRGADHAERWEHYTGLDVESRYRIVWSPMLGKFMGHHISKERPALISSVVGTYWGAADACPRWDFESFSAVTLHELTHAELDEALEDYPEKIEASEGCYGHLKQECRSSWKTCLQEQIAEGVSRRIYSQRNAPQNPHIFSHESRPFVSWVEEALADFEKNRGEYENLGVFYPRILDSFKKRCENYRDE